MLAVSMASGAVAAQAQTTRRTRRESSANRKARIARMIAETYSHRYEVAGGGGFLRFQSGAPQRNNEVTFFMSGTYFLNPKIGIIGDIRGLVRKREGAEYGMHDHGCQPTSSGSTLRSRSIPFLGGVAYRSMRKKRSP